MIYAAPLITIALRQLTLSHKKHILPVIAGLFGCALLFVSANRTPYLPPITHEDLHMPAPDVLELLDVSALEYLDRQSNSTRPNVITEHAENPAPAASASPIGKTYEIKIQPGDTLLSILVKSGIDERAAMERLQNLEKAFNPHTLKAGDNVELVFKPASYSQEKAPQTDKELGLMLIERQNQDSQLVSLDTDQTYFWSNPAPYKTGWNAGPVVISSDITSSFIGSARKAGLSGAHIQDVVDLLRYTVDFGRDIQKGASFTLMYQRTRDSDGALQNGPLEYVELNNRGKRIQLFRTTLEDGEVGYFDETGRTNKRSIMKTPVDGARISSRFGMRIHPILGYNKMHKGIDFAAPTGTPIVAAGDGVIDKIYRSRSYGNYIKIRHKNHYKTAYAHMSRFAKGMKRGTRVSQGDIIGYVGSTGRSTGPHLHFEILHNNKHINPMKIKDFGATVLAGQALIEFKKNRDKILALIKTDIRVTENHITE